MRNKKFWLPQGFPKPSFDNHWRRIVEFEELKLNDIKNEILKSQIENCVMCGDINLFFHPYLEENEAEIDVMIGEEKLRGKGLAIKMVMTMI